MACPPTAQRTASVNSAPKRLRQTIPNLQLSMSELRSAMREHIDKIRTLAVRQLAGERPRGDETRD